MKGNGKPRVNMANAILNVLTYGFTSRQIARQRALASAGLAELDQFKATRLRMANKPRARHARCAAGSKLLRAAHKGTIGVRHPSAVDSYFNVVKPHRIGRRLGV